MKSFLITAIVCIASITISFAQSLSAQSKSIQDAFEALKSDTSSKAKQLAYIKTFPGNKKEFSAVFASGDFKQLSDGYKYIEEFTALVAHYPNEVISKAINIGKNLKWDADAVNYLQHGIVYMANTHTNTFVKNINALPAVQANNLIVFLADVENHANYPEYKALINKLKSIHQNDLANKFIIASSKRQLIKDH